MIKVINVINTAKISKEDFEKLVKFYQNYDDEKFEIILVIPKNSGQLDVTELSKIRVIEIEELEKNIWNIDVRRAYKDIQKRKTLHRAFI